MPGSGTRGATHPPAPGLPPTLSVPFCPPPLPSRRFNIAFPHRWPLAPLGRGTVGMWGARVGAWPGSLSYANNSKENFLTPSGSSGLSSFTLALTQKSKEAHLPLRWSGTASLSSSSPGQSSVAFERFPQAGVSLMSGRHYLLYTSYSRKVSLLQFA